MKSFKFGVITTGALLFPVCLFAQQNSSNAESLVEKRVSKSRILEEVVVTAQKREENLADVPISIAAFSGEKLEALGIDDIQGLPSITPGLQIENLVGYSIIFLRGVGSDIFLPSADSSVATYLDGIYTPFAHGLAQDLGKISRIEVLKGPQGTLFGRNSTGGAINTVTEKPRDEFYINAAVDIGNYNRKNTKLYITGPLLDNLQASLSVFKNSQDTYYSRPAGSQYPDDLGEDVSRAFQAKVKWDITDSMDLTLTTMKSRFKGVTDQLLTSMETRPLFAAILEDREPYEADPDNPVFGKNTNELSYLEYNWATPSFFDTKVMASYQSIKTDFSVDFDGDNAPLARFAPTDQGARYVTAEAQFVSNEESWNSEHFKWIAGYFFYRQRDAGFRNIQLSVAESLTGALSPVLDPILMPLSSLLGQLGLPLPSDVNIYFDGLVDTDAHAVFAEATHTFFDYRVGVTFGARYQAELKKLTQSQLGLVNADGSLSNPLVAYNPDERDSDDESYKVTIDYRLENGLIFLTASKGVKSGAFQVANILSDPEFVKPEKANSIELGGKLDLFDSALRLGFGVFQNEVENVQVANIALQNGGAISFENAGASRIRGVDGDLQWVPFMVLAPSFVVSASAAYLEGEYTDYKNASGFDESSGLFLSGTEDYTGNVSVRTPEITYNIGLNYSFYAVGGEFEAGVSYYYNDGFYFDAQNSAIQPDYSLINAQLSYFHEDSQIRVTAYGTNLGESEYFSSRFPVDFNVSGKYAPPRFYGVRLNWEY